MASFWGNFDYGTPDEHLQAAMERIATLEQERDSLLDRKCENCKHWEHQQNEERGTCLAACYPPKGKGLATVQHSFEYLLTLPEFSCNQWEAK